MTSVIITARNEIYLQKTIENVLANAEGEIEVIAICDGYWPDPPIKDDPRVVIIHHTEARGQRQSINEAARIAKGKYIMKLDAHCAVDKGFDVKLAQDCEYDWTVIPRMYNLDVATWQPKLHKRTDYMYIGWNDKNEMRALYYEGDEWKKWHRREELIDEVMCCMGPGWFMHKDRFWELGGCDETHGSWGQQGIEVALKAWLSGGRLVVNKKTWFAHWFRASDGGFPYPITDEQIKKARQYSMDLWLNNKWDKQVRTLQWLVDKFNPSGWGIESLNYESQVCHIVGCGQSELSEADFGEGPIIAINEAITKVESLNLKNPIYSMQKDVAVVEPKSPLLLSELTKDIYPGHKRYTFNTHTWFKEKEFSANVALKIAQLWGCDVKMLCCDSLNGDFRGPSPEKYERQLPRMRRLIEKENLNIVNMDFKDDYQKQVNSYLYANTHVKKHYPTWKGIKILKLPTDLWLYHQVLWETKPEVIVEIGTKFGGLSLYLADLGVKVITVDILDQVAEKDPRITYLLGDSTSPEIIAKVKELTQGKRTMVILDGDHSRVKVKWELHHYSPLVSSGCYLVAEDCYSRDSLRYGPCQARDWFLARSKSFTQTNLHNEFLVGMNVGGWLRRK